METNEVNKSLVVEVRAYYEGRNDEWIIGALAEENERMEEELRAAEEEAERETVEAHGLRMELAKTKGALKKAEEELEDLRRTNGEYARMHLKPKHTERDEWPVQKSIIVPDMEPESVVVIRKDPSIQSITVYFKDEAED